MALLCSRVLHLALCAVLRLVLHVVCRISRRMPRWQLLPPRACDAGGSLVWLGVRSRPQGKASMLQRDSLASQPPPPRRVSFRPHGVENSTPFQPPLGLVLKQWLALGFNLP